LRANRHRARRADRDTKQTRPERRSVAFASHENENTAYRDPPRVCCFVRRGGGITLGINWNQLGLATPGGRSAAETTASLGQMDWNGEMTAGLGRNKKNRAARLAIVAVLTSAPALADEAKPAEPAPADDQPTVLTGIPAFAPVLDFKKQLKDKGVALQLNYIGEVLGNATGGQRQGAIYDGRLEFVLDADMEKIAGVKGGAIHGNAYWIQGTGLSRDYVGNLLTVSNIEALPTVRLYELWYEQKTFDDRLGVRFGQLAADTEFITSKYAALFINSTFGWPDSWAADLPSGGPAYPLATPGVRVKLGADSDAVNVLAAVFNGDPAGQCGQNPQICNRYGTNFRLQDPPLAFQEIQVKYNQGKDDKGLAGTVKFGAYEHFGNFSNQRYDLSDQPLGVTGAMAGVLNGDWGFYGILDQQIWRLGSGDDAGKGAAVFLRVAGAPGDRNLIDFYIDGGLNFSGVIPGRPDDAFGVAVAYAHISDYVRGFDLESGLPVARSSETALELTYQYQVAPGWSLQPDVQYIFNPGGGVVDASGARAKDAAVFGVRTTINF
jgi:porin